jgi:zinc protease
MTDVRIHTLANGCKVILRPTPGKDILSIVAAVNWGGRDDQPDQAGLTNLMAGLLIKGTETRTAFEIAETLESVGASIDSFCTHDAFGMETQSASEDWEVSLDVLGDCLFESVFRNDEFDKERAMVQAGIRRSEDDKFGFTYKKCMEVFHRGHPYGTPSNGDIETVGLLQRAAVRELHTRVARPEQMLLIAVGNVPEAEFLAAVEKRFSTDTSGAELKRRDIVRSPALGLGETLIMRKDSEQAFIVVAYPAPPVGDDAGAALRLACGILGEGMSARLFARLRDRDHLAYAVGASMAVRALASHVVLFIGTGPATQEKARQGLLREAAALLTEPPTDAEIDRARRYILGKHLIGRQTNSALAHSMMAGELNGLGWKWGETFPERMAAATAAQALATVEQYLHTPAIAILEPEAS